jgi:hypothetical protein
VRKTLLVLALALVGVAGIPVAADAKLAPQITDPSLDYPVPFGDLVSVGVSVVSAKGGDRLEVAFKVAGAISPEGRNLMFGYEFRAKVGKCDLAAGFNAFPSVTENAGLPAGASGAQCGATGREIEGTFRIQGDTVTAEIPLRDLKGVALGNPMTGLTASTAPGRGFNGDDTRAAGDAATSDKAWVLSRG